MMNYIGFVLALLFTIASCSEDDKLVTYRIDFDLRQCEGNPWLKDNQIPSTINEHLSMLSEYLNTQNVEVLNSEIDNEYHSIVCEACYFCPAGPRIRIEVLSRDTAAVYRLDLLNTSTVECPDEF